jgi:hypothetical protein
MALLCIHLDPEILATKEVVGIRVAIQLTSITWFFKEATIPEFL